MLVEVALRLVERDGGELAGSGVGEELALEVPQVRCAVVGALKWMLNDVPNGANPRENKFGILRADGSAKPIASGLRTYAQTAPTATGALTAAALAPPACKNGGQPGRAASAASAQRPLGRVVVAGTDGEGVFMRRTPRSDDRLQAWSDGTALDLLGPDVEQDGLRWSPVRDPCGVSGWVPARYAAPGAS
jgi:hypothetical protein